MESFLAAYPSEIMDKTEVRISGIAQPVVDFQLASMVDMLKIRRHLASARFLKNV